MAKLTTTLFSTLKSHKLNHHLPPLTTLHPPNQSHFSRLFSRTTTTPPKHPTRNTNLNFSPSDSDDSDDDSPPPSHNPNPPPPYNPFNKTPDPTPHDPTNLQEVFHKIRTDGLNDSAVKMFDALSKDGLTHEALELFSQIKDGHMPDVVAHTAVIDAYASAGKAKEALKVYMRMLASGVLPNAYTYTVLIKVLAGSDDHKLVGEAYKYFMEMMVKNIRPNPGTCLAVFEGLVKGGKEEECRELVAKMKALGFAPDKESLRELLKSKRGQVYRSVMNILFAD